jgi:hypothetical protein
MAKKFKDYKSLERKRIKRPGRHSKSPNKASRKMHKKKYRGQGKWCLN